MMKEIKHSCFKTPLTRFGNAALMAWIARYFLERIYISLAPASSDPRPPILHNVFLSRWFNMTRSVIYGVADFFWYSNWSDTLLTEFSVFQAWLGIALMKSDENFLSYFELDGYVSWVVTDFGHRVSMRYGVLCLSPQPLAFSVLLAPSQGRIPWGVSVSLFKNGKKKKVIIITEPRKKLTKLTKLKMIFEK